MPVGSIKTNVGHLEPASGLAGLLKAVLVLQQGQIPPSLHGRPLNPAIDFEALNLEPLAEMRPLQVTDCSVVGVNSFGFGGANAHVALGAPPPRPPAEQPTAGPQPIVITASSSAALLDNARRMAAHLEVAGDDELPNIAYTSAVRRGRRGHRLATLGADRLELAANLRAFAGGLTPPATASVAGPVRRGGVAFAFSGNGSQWPGMGADLLRAPAFRQAVEEFDTLLKTRAGWCVIDELRASPADSRLRKTEYAQPALLAVQLGLLALVAERGIQARAVFGHSVGEVAAAYAAGALDLTAAVDVIVERSQAQALTAGRGRMAAVGLAEAEAAKALAAYDGRLQIAAVNGDADLTISGDEDQLAEFGQAMVERGVFFRPLDLDYAFHSRHMDPIEPLLRAGLRDLVTRSTSIELISTVTGDAIDGACLDAEYWWRNIREPVRFAGAARRAMDAGCDVIVEIGPHSVLEGYLRRLVASRADDATVVPSLRREQPGPACVDTAVATVLAATPCIDWSAYFPKPGRVCSLPAYAWQKERHWNGTPDSWVRGEPASPLDDHLLGRRLPTVDPTWLGLADPSRLRWLADHKVGSAVVMPGAGHVHLALTAGARILDSAVELIAMGFIKALAVNEAAPPEMQVCLSSESGTLRISSRADAASEWQLNARGRVQRLVALEGPAIDLGQIRERMRQHVSAEEHYAWTTSIGLPFGPAFRVLSWIELGDGEALGMYAVEGSDADALQVTVIDAGLQAAARVAAAEMGDRLYLPMAVERVRWWRPPAKTGFVHAYGVRVSAHEIGCCVRVLDAQGRPAIELDGVSGRHYQPVDAAPAVRHEQVLRTAPSGVEPSFARLGMAELAAAVEARLPGLRQRFDTDVFYTRYRAREDELCGHIAAAVLRHLSPSPAYFTRRELVADIVPPYERLVESLIAIAEADGFLASAGPAAWRLVREGEPDALFAAMVRDFPGYTDELMLLGQAAMHLPDVVRGEASGLEYIFPERGTDTTEHLYDGSVSFGFHNAVVGAIAAEVVENLPADGCLRILEIGGGTGGCTASVLSVLPAERTQYVFTDISEVFATRAAARFEQFDFVQYRRLDIERDPAEQDFELHAFDVVIAANVLHATANLPSALRNVSGLLAEGGLLVAVEGHARRWLEMVFGMLGGWWLFDDGLRKTSPLMAPADWRAVLASAGFAEVAELDDQPPLGLASRGSVLVARKGVGVPVLNQAEVPAAAWLVATSAQSQGALAEDLTRALQECGCAAVQALRTAPAAQSASAAVIEFDREDEWLALIGAVADQPASVGVALLVDEDQPELPVLQAIVAALSSLPLEVGAQLAVVTRPTGLLPGPETPLEPWQAVHWGITRSIGNEQPRVSVRRISFGAGAQARRLAHELSHPGAEDEVVLTEHGRFVPRLSECRPAPVRQPASYALETWSPGSTYRLAWVEQTVPVPGPGEVLIDVRAAALSYHNVLVAMGIIGDAQVEDGYGGKRLGIDGAGVVAAIGRDVSGFKVGDRVYSMTPGVLRAHTLTRAALTAHLPEGVSFAGGATIPVVFLTAHYGLGHLAHLQPGETVLIHGAAGGVGLAAIQVARRLGAEIIATAGTPDKRDLLHLIGVDHVLDSRTLQFSEEVLDLTQGKGVDVVLNSLAGEALVRNLDIVSKFGRFVEIGKRDLYADMPIGLRPFRNNVSFSALDLDQLMKLRPDIGDVQFAEVARLVREGVYRPLPHWAFPANRVHEAYRVLQRSRHVGKVVVSFADPPPVTKRRQAVRVDPDATYLVVGGLAGFGAAAAEWLAQKGARHLALMGRRGEATPGAQDRIQAWARRGVQATAYSADVANRNQVSEVFRQIAESAHPLRGVIHAAMVLDDAAFLAMTPTQFEAVLAPKARGAAVLDDLTRRLDLQFFVAFSSISGTFGAPGQANYAGANAYLEALVRQRRSAGLPGLAVAWGAIGEVGYLARKPELAQSVADHFGVRPISPVEAFAALEDLLADGAEVATVGRYGWARVPASLPALGRPRFSRVVSLGGAETKRDAGELRDLLMGLPAPEALQLMEDTLAELIADILRMPESRLDRSRRLTDLGMDSLMAIELQLSIEGQLGCTIPAIELNGAAAIRDLSLLVASRCGLVAAV
ncbi:MAG TPA: SDR family NAD(P)-dependent oxidoreductase [Chloroflexota bacterium]|nr:SDR family NAD(P)-dependent oxidoreductase [Chloroflexota bacterium]